MRAKSEDNTFINSPELNQLHILELIASYPQMTQAELARRCGLSIAMVNNYMQGLCRAGFLEYHRKSSRNVSYHVTSHGQALAATIEMKFIQDAVDLYAHAKKRLYDLIARQAQPQLMFRRAILFGGGHFGELTLHALESAGVSVIGVCDGNPASIGREWCGRQVVNPSQIKYMAPDAVVIVDIERTNEIYQELCSLVDHGIQVVRLDASVKEFPLGELPSVGQEEVLGSSHS